MHPTCPVCSGELSGKNKHCTSSTCSWLRCVKCAIDIDVRLGMWKAAGR